MSGSKKRMLSLFLASIVSMTFLFTGCNWFNASAKVNKQLELGVKYLSENNFEEAVLAYREAIKIDKKSIPAYKGLGVAYAMQGKPDQAEQALRDGLEQVAVSAALQLALAGLMIDQNKKDQAEAIYKDVIAKDGGCLPAYQAYARLLAGLNRKNEAVALLEKAAAGNAGHYRISCLLAEQYIKTGSRDKVLAAVSQSLAAEPNQAAAYKLLEIIYDGRWAELASLGEQYILQGKPVAGTAIKLAGLYRQGKYGDMIKLYDQSANEIKASPKIRLLAAQAYLKLGQKDQGLGLGSGLKPADIKDPALLAEAAGFYLEVGDKAAARGLALRGIGLDDTVLDNYAVLSRSYQDEDKSQSDIWLTKYLLGSAYSIKEAKALAEGKDGQKAEIKTEKPASENVPEISQKISLEEVYRYLPSQQYKIRRTLYSDVDNDGVEELAITINNFDMPTGNRNEDGRYMVFKKTGSDINILASGKMPAAGLASPMKTFKIGERNILVINDIYGADGGLAALALTMRNGSLQPVWRGSELKDIDSDGVVEAIYYLDHFHTEYKIFEWDESRQCFLDSRGETTGYRLSD